MLTRHIYLIGMPGSGKSSLGRRVAANLRLPYTDIDRRIEEVFQMPTGDVLTTYGEEAFRTIETNMLVQVSREQPGIVSTGGGAVLRELNRTIMRNSGVILLIDRPLEDIKSDIKLDRRPLLARKGPTAVDDTYNARIDIYRASADITFVNGKDLYETVNQLQRLILTRFQL